MRYLFFVLLAFASSAYAEPWNLHLVSAREKSFVGNDVTAILNVSAKFVSSVTVEKFPVSGPLPRTEAEWQDFVVSHIHNGHDFRAERKTLLHAPRLAFVSETTYMESADAKMEKMLAVVMDGSIYLFKTNDFPDTFVLNNARHYKALFQDIAFGRRDDLLKQIASNTGN